MTTGCAAAISRPDSKPMTGAALGAGDGRLPARHPGALRTPLAENQIPEQAQKFGISEERVVKNIMLKDTVNGEFTTVQDVAEAALFFAAFESNALTRQSLVVSHGWFMR
jgi:hypothetical protein